MERRQYKRSKHRLPARFIVGDREILGAVTNLSQVGLFVQTNVHPDPGSLLSLRIGSGQSVIPVEGPVVWNSPHGIGLVLNNPPQGWLACVERLRKLQEAGLRGPQERYDVRHRVSFKSAGEFLSEYTENLSHGGMYISTDRPLAAGSTIEAAIEIPGFDAPLTVLGSVRYRLDSGVAANTGRGSGVGIQFVELGTETKRRLHQYLKRLEIHRHRPGRRQTGALPVSGTLSDYIVPELLLGMKEERFTGKLLLEHQEVSKTIYFSSGLPVFTDSSARSEAFGHYLIRHGRISDEALETCLRQLESSDLRLGEYLVQSGFVSGGELSSALVAQHEERITNTFSWFDGNFLVYQSTDWLDGVTPLPMNTYDLVFRGVDRWIDPSIVASWMGLHESSILKRTARTLPEGDLPPKAARILRMANPGVSLADAAQRLSQKPEAIYPSTFALVLAGWIDIEQPRSARVEIPVEEAPTPDPEKPSASKQLLDSLARRIDNDFKRFVRLDFYEILGVNSSVDASALSNAFLAATSPYANVSLESIPDAALRQKVESILSWVRLAYDTLKTPALRQAYARRGRGRGKTDLFTEQRLEAERALMSGMRALENHKMEEALRTFEEAVKKHPTDSGLRGYLGWVLFKKDSKELITRATELLDSALTQERSDPHLWYFRGEIYGFVGSWEHAERCFHHAVQVSPTFAKAIRGREEAQSKRMHRERLTRKTMRG